MQRYKMTIEAEWISDALEYAKLIPKADNKGEWVKWEDIEKLIEINESIKSHILSIQEHISNIADMTNRGLIHYGA